MGNLVALKWSAAYNLVVIYVIDGVHGSKPFHELKSISQNFMSVWWLAFVHLQSCPLDESIGQIRGKKYWNYKGSSLFSYFFFFNIWDLSSDSSKQTHCKVLLTICMKKPVCQISYFTIQIHITSISFVL